MQLTKKIIPLLGMTFCAVALQGCKLDRIIDGMIAKGVPNPSSTLAWSEQGTFTPDGRFFVIGGNQPFTYGPTGTIVNGISSIYEIKKDAQGKYANVAIVNGSVGGQSCYFGSMTSVRYLLYATCTNLSQLVPASVLYRVDTRKAASDPARITSVPLTTYAFQPNGMAVDQAGDLYVPNSISFAATAFYGVPNVPAIVKIKIAHTDALSIQESSWLPAAFGGYSPNGVAITGNQLYLPSLNVIYRIPIMPGGGAGAPSVAYQTDKNNLFDNLTILPGGLIAAPEITNPNQAMVQIAYPGTPAPTALTNQVTLINIKTGKKLGAQTFPAYALPSSVTVTPIGFGNLFPFESAIVTDAIGAGGLYLLQR